MSDILFFAFGIFCGAALCILLDKFECALQRKYDAYKIEMDKHRE